MELTEKEKMLIEAIREMKEDPHHVLSQYRASVKANLENASPYRKEIEKKKIEVATLWLRKSL